jgi:UDP-2,3-diacylglucosamine pyrophosphatase LpxH
MARPQTEARKITAEICSKFPDAPSHSLAEKLFTEYPEAFDSAEHARNYVRTVRGKIGKKSRTSNSQKELIDTKQRPSNPYALPKSYAKKRRHIELKGTKFLMLYDIHIPYQDNEALSLAINEGICQGCDAVVLGGDALDCHELSDFVKDPRKRKFKEELYAMRQFVDTLRKQFPKAHIYYKEGNHEERYWRFMRVKAPQLVDIDAFDFASLCHLDKHNITWVDGKSKLNIGKLSIFHGHEFGKQFMPSVNVARGLYMKTKVSSMCGHHHQTAEHNERDANGKFITCWGVACLSELSPDYNPYSRYNHGFAIVDKGANGSFSVHNYRIHEGRIL